MNWLLREPLTQFFVIGAALFIAGHSIANHKEDASRHIVVDTKVVRRLATLYEMQTGQQPSQARLDALIEEYIREEVSFREALRMGLDQNDEIVRRRLTQKLEFLARDRVVVPEPSDAVLMQYYDEHAAQFTEPATVTFSHIFFSPDAAGSAAAQRRAEATLRRLPSRTLVRPPAGGDRFPLQHNYAGLTTLDAVQLFGRFPVVDALFSSPMRQWVGPFQSGYGWHLVFVNQRTAAVRPAFAEIRERVTQAYLAQRRREVNEQQLADMQQGYTITRAYQNGSR